MSFGFTRPNRTKAPIIRSDNDATEPIKKPKTIGKPEVCLNCPKRECKRGWCERVSKY